MEVSSPMARLALERPSLYRDLDLKIKSKGQARFIQEQITKWLRRIRTALIKVRSKIKAREDFFPDALSTCFNRFSRSRTFIT
jgi:hypothetical protein